ncbi:hypothetical protein [uncultured Chryseobacterium sp.]|uniref:hypothetical protein n=1 Tax=uncultured Chryseobacterium sp. TaxID=259322 RepID=UPI0025F7BF09|nr:hypothetical protein [uncultured Chryseobacterium sp.]
MKFFISIFIIFTIALRPVLPLIDYAVNYKYIVKNLCENRNIPQSTCKGKCYLEKELSKTGKQTGSAQNIKLSGIDIFLSNEILSFSNNNNSAFQNDNRVSEYVAFHTSEYIPQVYHPPLM